MSSSPSILTVRERNLPLIVAATAAAVLLSSDSVAVAQRVLGLDVSAWQTSITTTEWATLKRPTNQQVGGVFGDGRDFVIIRSSRGGTTGYYDQNDADNSNGLNTLSQRYDDPYFVQNINRATAAGLFAGAYHFARPDIIATTQNSGGIANTGTDEADHFIQMAGPWMRPGYLPPMYDFEAGDGVRTDEQMAQFSLDFSNRIHAVMGIRPSIYTNGNYAANILGGASASLRDQLAEPSSTPPSVIGPAYPTLVSARWPNQSNPGAIDVQNAHPKDSYAPIYGPWDDYGTTHPWQIWQYASTMKLNGNNNLASNTDVDVAQGDMEYVKDLLIPAVWMNDNSGDWSETWPDGSAGKNWNSGLPVVAPVTGPGQVPPVGTQTLPTKRLPGAAGGGPTAGSNDTVILERPNANVTVTISTGSHNIRKMYMRETLNITGGTLTINYDPDYNSDFDNNASTNFPNALRSGPISAQFSGPVTLGGTGNLSVNTLQVDATKTFTLAGSTGTLTFNEINLMPHSTTPAKIAVTGNVNINPLTDAVGDATAKIVNGSGAGNTGFIDLNGSARTFNVGNGSADVDLDVAVPITNGGLTKNGAGTMRLSGNNTFAGNVTVNSGVLRYNHSSGLNSSTLVTVNTGGTLDMNNTSDTIAGLAGTGGAVTQGAASLTISAASGSNFYSGAITGTGALIKSGASTQVLAGNNSLGAVTVNAGSLLFNGSSTTGAVAVANSATLGGTGSVSGAVTINSSGHLAPGASIESLDVGALTLSAGSVLDFELNTVSDSDLSDLVNVTNSGGLVINGGTLNLANAGNMTSGTYTLLDYAGSLGGSLANLSFGTTPVGYDYYLTNTGSTIDLVVEFPGDFNHDSSVDAADYLVWRSSGGTAAQYDTWRANFGAVESGGGGTGGAASAAVPEPAAGVLLLGLSMQCGWRRCRRRA
jgi:autotransporter-associated beta strand protein